MKNHKTEHEECPFALKEFKDDPKENIQHMFKHALLDPYEIRHGDTIDKCLCCAIRVMEKEFNGMLLN